MRRFLGIIAPGVGLGLSMAILVVLAQVQPSAPAQDRVKVEALGPDGRLHTTLNGPIPPAPPKGTVDGAVVGGLPVQVHPAVKAKRPRGLKPSAHYRDSRAKKAGAHPTFTPHPGIPQSYYVIPTQLSYWGNDTLGDCVTAATMAGIAEYSLMCGLPEVFIPSATAVAWATQYGYTNGAVIVEVLQTMQSVGITSNGVTYTAGPPSSVDYTNYAEMCAAITVGPLHVGVDADQLDNTVGTVNGWLALGYSNEQDEDHCIEINGYGTLQVLASALGVTLPATLPNGLTPSSPAYMVTTWNTVGVIDTASLINIGSEAWLETPTINGDSPSPMPSPAPSPAPTPSPVPGPTPSPSTSQIVVDATLHQVTLPAGWTMVMSATPNEPVITIHPPRQVIAVPKGYTLTGAAPMPAPSPPVPGPAPSPSPVPAGGWSGTITISGGVITGVVPVAGASKP